MTCELSCRRSSRSRRRSPLSPGVKAPSVHLAPVFQRHRRPGDRRLDARPRLGRHDCRMSRWWTSPRARRCRSAAPTWRAASRCRPTRRVSRALFYGRVATGLDHVPGLPAVVPRARRTVRRDQGRVPVNLATSPWTSARWTASTRIMAMDRPTAARRRGLPTPAAAGSPRTVAPSPATRPPGRIPVSLHAVCGHRQCPRRRLQPAWPGPCRATARTAPSPTRSR